MPARASLAAVVAVAVALRAAAAWLLGDHAPPAASDPWWYHATAATLAEGRGYVHPLSGRPTAAWPPGYPMILAALYAALGPSPAWALALNVAAGVVTCLATARLAAAAVAPRAAVAAAALVAVAPSHVLFSSLLMSESLSAALLALLLAWSATLVDREAASGSPAPGPWLAWGAAAGFAALVRAEFVLVPVLAMAAALRAGKPHRTAAASSAAASASPAAAAWRRALARSAVVGAGMALVLGPWAARNAAVFGAFVPLSTSFGRTAIIGHNPDAHGGMNLWMPDPMRDSADQAAGDPGRELAVDRRLRAAAWDFARSNPAAELALVPRRAAAMFRGDRVWSEWYAPSPSRRASPGFIEAAGRVANLFWWILLVAALASMPRLVRRANTATFLLVATPAAWTAFFAVVLYGSQRFHFVLLPLLAVAASATVERVIERVRGGD